MDTSAITGFKQPDPMQSISGLLNIANSAQQNQKGAIDLENASIGLNERKAAIPFLQAGSFINPDGTLDTAKLTSGLTRAAPTTGMKLAQDYATAHTQAAMANRALNSMADENRTRAGNVLFSVKPGTPVEEVFKAVDALGAEMKGFAPIGAAIKTHLTNSSQQGGQAAVDADRMTIASGFLPQDTQQAMATPAGVNVSDGQTTKVVSTKPGTIVPVGSTLPGTGAQMRLPPTTPVVGPNNQPGYLGEQPPAPPAQAGVNGNFVGDPAKISADIDAMKDPQERANARSAFEEQARRTPGFAQGSSFVPSGPVPGANESKAASVQVMNDHWAKLNKDAENSQLLEGLLGNIKSLAPGAITGTESGRKAYVVGLLNSLKLGDRATGNLQTDTDLLEKNIAQLGLNTPASTDAMRTIVGLARPHGTMSEGAIQEAAAQLSGQIQANRAIRNELARPKQLADQSGDPSVYQSAKSHLEEIADPRAWQLASMDHEGKTKMLAKLRPEDRAALRKKMEALIDLGLIK